MGLAPFSVCSATPDRKQLRVPMPLEPIGNVFAGQPAAVWFGSTVGSGVRYTLIVFVRLKDTGELAFREFDILGSFGRMRLEARDPSNEWQRTGIPISGSPVAVNNGDAWRLLLWGQDDLPYLFWSNGSSRFGPEQIHPLPKGVTLARAMSGVVSSQGLLNVFLRDTSDTLWRFSQQPGFQSVPEMQSETLGAGIKGTPKAAAFRNGVLHVFARGADGGLWVQVMDGTRWLGLRRLMSDPLFGDPAVVKVQFPLTREERVVVPFLLDGGFRLGYVAYNPYEFDLARRQTASGAELAGLGRGLPGVGSRTGGDIALFCWGPTGSILHSSMELSAVAPSQFGDWVTLDWPQSGSPFLPPGTNVPVIPDTNFPSGPGAPVVAGIYSSLTVLMRGNDGRLWRAFYDGARFV